MICAPVSDIKNLTLSMVVSSNVCSSLNTMDFTIFFHTVQRFFMANFGKENRTSRLFFAYSGFSGCVICFCRLLCLFQHGLGKDAVAPGRVVDQHMGHRADQAAVL